MPLNLLITFENNSLTLDHPGDDYSAGGTTLTAIGSPTMPTTQPFAGLRSGYLPNPSQYWYMPSAGIFSIADGSYAFSFYHDAVWPTSEAFNFREIADVSNHLLGRFTGADGTGGFEVNIRVGAFGQITISTGDLGLGIGAYYSGKVEWDEAATTIRIKIYDALGVQIGSTTVNTSVTAGVWPSTIDRLIFGDASGVNGDWYIDNLLLGSTASEPLEDNFDVATYGDYGGSTILSADSPVLDAEQDNAFAWDGAAPTSVIIRDVATGNHVIDVFASLVSLGGNNYTYDMPDVAAQTTNILGTVFDSASHTHLLEVSDGTDTATFTIVVNPKVGRVAQEITSAIKTVGSTFENFLGAVVDSSQLYYPSTETVDDTQPDYFKIGADGTILTNITNGTFSCMFFDTTAEMVVNSEFEIDDHWILGANWSIASDVASHTSGSSSDIYQTPALDIVDGGTYEFVYPMANRTGGTATIGLIGGTPVNGTARSTNATHTESLVANATNNQIRIASSVTGAFDINSLSVKRTDVPGGIWKPFDIIISEAITVQNGRIVKSIVISIVRAI